MGALSLIALAPIAPLPQSPVALGPRSSQPPCPFASFAFCLLGLQPCGPQNPCPIGFCRAQGLKPFSLVQQRKNVKLKSLVLSPKRVLVQKISVFFGCTSYNLKVSPRTKFFSFESFLQLSLYSIFVYRKLKS